MKLILQPALRALIILLGVNRVKIVSRITSPVMGVKVMVGFVLYTPPTLPPG